MYAPESSIPHTYKHTNNEYVQACSPPSKTPACSHTPRRARPSRTAASTSRFARSVVHQFQVYTQYETLTHNNLCAPHPAGPQPRARPHPQAERHPDARAAPPGILPLLWARLQPYRLGRLGPPGQAPGQEGPSTAFLRASASFIDCLTAERTRRPQNTSRITPRPWARAGRARHPGG